MSFLGLNLVWAVNLLSMLSLAALLVLIMTFAELLFSSRPVARISALLFFLASSSLSYIPFLLKQESLSGAIDAIFNLRDFLTSGYPFRGDDWGGLTVGVFSNQRHLISAAGLLLVVMVFLIGLYRRKGVIRNLDESFTESPVIVEDLPDAESPFDGEFLLETEKSAENELIPPASIQTTRPSFADFRTEAAGLVFCGVLLGLLPYWNSAVFVSAAIVIGSLFVFFSFRRYLAVLIAVMITLGLPQILMLRSGNAAQTGDSLFTWGYTIAEPTVALIFEYIGWTFGIKWLLLAIALWFVPNAHRRLLLVITSLVPVVFLFKLSTDAFNNHKLLNIWGVLVSVYVAYALWLIGRRGFVRAGLAVMLAIFMSFGAVIDLFPIRNDGSVGVPFENDRLTTWLFENTKPSDVFLTHTLLSHPILFTGRKIFLGNTLFAWTAGYMVGDREALYRQMFTENNPATLIGLLNESKISFVAIDDGVRTNGSLIKLNEIVFRQHFEKVFEDAARQYGNLTIYKVPQSLSTSPIAPTPVGNNALATPSHGVQIGGLGKAQGEFDRPRGITIDKEENLFVADTMNSRIQKFSSDGTLQFAIQTSGEELGELKEPNAIALDRDGNIYVADALAHRILKYTADGKFVLQWQGPEPGFLGPRAIVSANNLLYVLDQGRSRVVAIDTNGKLALEWGKKGIGDSEFAEPTGLEVTTDRVYVADTGNNRIQIFDLEGKFLAMWPVPEWKNYPWHYPDVAFDAQSKKLYVTSPQTKEILVFDPAGNRLEPLRPKESNDLNNPSALAIANSKSGKLLNVVDTGSSNIYPFQLGSN